MNRKKELESLATLDGMLEVAPSALAERPDYSDYPYTRGDQNSEEEQTVHLRDVLRKIRKHKWLILALVTVVTTLVTIYAYRIKPWYTAATVLEIGKENTMVLKTGEITLNDDSDPQYLVNANTKMLTLESAEFYEKVAAELKLEQNPRLNEPEAKPGLLARMFGEETSDVASKLKATNTEDQRRHQMVAFLKRKTSSELIKNTRALRISFTDEDPKFAAEATNAIGQVFMQQNFDKVTEKFTNSAEWLDTTTRELKAKVEKSEEALAAYTRENEIYATESGSAGKGSETLTTSKLTQLHDQYIKAQTERTLKQSLYDQLQAGRLNELPEAFSDPFISDAKKKLAQLQESASEMKVKFGPNHPKMQEANNQIATVTSQIETSRKALIGKLKADFERALKDERSLSSELEKAKGAAINENQAAIKYNILKQDVETARGLYTDFLQKTNQAKAQLAEQNNNIRVIQKAQVPAIPVGPRKTQIVAIAFLLSLGMGIGLAFFLEYLDNTIKTIEDVERYAQLPTLGIIPPVAAAPGLLKSALKGNREIATQGDGSQLALEVKPNDVQNALVLSLDTHSLAGEAYRALRTSLLLSAAGTPPKTMLITSSQPGEGKSTTTVNTAISLAQLGAKVIIVDCDLRKPSIHKHLDVSPSAGVSNFLSSKSGTEGLIQKLAIPNLDVMPSGPIPPNPAELLSSKRMADLIETLSEEYDHVLIDSPPVINVTDPVILSTMVDGTIMVVHGGKTTRDAVQRARQDLSSVRAKIYGAVLNNVDFKKDGYDYYYYRYSKYGTYGNSANG